LVQIFRVIQTNTRARIHGNGYKRHGQKDVEIHRTSSSEPCSKFGKCQDPSASSPNTTSSGDRCGLDLPVELVSVTPDGRPLLSTNMIPGACPSPLLFVGAVLPSSNRSDRVSRKSMALSAPERLYMNMTMKVATEGIWRVLLPNPEIHRTTLSGRTIIE